MSEMSLSEYIAIISDIFLPRNFVGECCATKVLHSPYLCPFFLREIYVFRASKGNVYLIGVLLSQRRNHFCRHFVS